MPRESFDIAHDPGTDTVTIQADNADVMQMLRAFSLIKRFNLIPSPGVGGTATINLYDIPFDQALRLLLDQAELAYTRDGRSYHIHKKGQIVPLEPKRERLFPVNYLDRAELEPAVKSVLSTDGEQTYIEKQRLLIVRDAPERLEAVARVLAQLDRQPKQVLVEVTLIDVKLSDGMTLGVNFSGLAGIDFNELGATTNLRELDAGSGSLSGPRLDDGLGLLEQAGFAAPGTGLTIGIVKNNVAAFLDLLETVSEATVLANPKVLTLDGENASIQVGGRLGYLTTTVSQTDSTQTVNFLTTGTQLSITPRVRPNGFIELELSPNLSAGSINSLGLPEENTTNVQTKVLIRDGYTLAVGGLIQENTSISQRQLPLLGDLPLVGALFRRREELTGRQEVIFLITPHIIDPDAASHDALRRLRSFEEAREAFRGTLSLLMRHVRAETAYQLARENAREGRRDRALTWTSIATRSTPLHVPSWDLRRALIEDERLSDALSEIERDYEKQAPPRPPAAPQPEKEKGR